jgi:hypothetical protein
MKVVYTVVRRIEEVFEIVVESENRKAAHEAVNAFDDGAKADAGTVVPDVPVAKRIDQTVRAQYISNVRSAE